MKQNRIWVVCILLLGMLAYSLGVQNGGSGTVAQVREKSVFERVADSGVLRCGYVVYEPTVMKDPNTGELSGIIVDITERMAAKLDLRVEWTEELTWATFVEGLRNDRYDVFCGSAFGLPHEARYAEFIGPLFYSGIGAWVRADDHRFDNDVSTFNSPDVMVAALDGSIAGEIQNADYPQAKVLSAPHSVDYSINALNVASNKADVTFVEVYQGNAFLDKNPGSLRNIVPDNPLRLFPNLYLVRKGEFELQSMLQNVIEEMHRNGEIEPFIAKHEKWPGSFYRYQVPVR